MNVKWKVALGVSALALLLTACSGDPVDQSDNAAGSSPSNVATSGTEEEAEAGTEEEAVVGIQEKDVGDSGPQKAGDLIIVDAKYFQAIDMEHGSMQMPPASESDMHFEIDVATTAAAKEIGFEEDQFLPYLKISAKLTEKSTNKVVDLGTLMPMIASDGAHYGNNIKLEPGNYRVDLTIASPADDFMLHTGKDSSGVKGRFWDEPLKVTFDNFEWDGQLL